MSTAVNANVRVLELFVELLGARPGRTKTQLRALPGYRGLADDAFETQFQRDKDALRDAGAHMTIHSGERYSIAWDSFARGIEVTSADRALMSLAARAWDSNEFFADAIDAKAAAASPDDVSAPTIRLGLTGVGAAASLSQAIRERMVVCFEYPGSGELTERSVDPWALSVQGRALYLWGWDLDRRAERTFRVSRIRSQVSLLGEPGDASTPPEAAAPPRVSSLVSPVVDVRDASTARTLLHGYEAGQASAASGSTRPGWERVALEGGEMGTWIGRLLALASDVVVVSPESLREAMLTRLRAACAWGEHDA
ncbi:WYL domain-containing protein [Schaalia odontolytica]|uniref:helix-turn-helix transcriptional regulator n=1 Tax=Schaalia odontolytica TaxID=1660 RepID=UPI0028D1D3AB|nr:WYL domain-containing protein [Schaalia odontolytica]